MLAEEEQDQGGSGNDEQAGILAKGLPVQRGVCEDTILRTILENSLERAHRIHKEYIELDKLRDPDDPQYQSYWTGYWAGYSCSLQHTLDLIDQLNGKQIEEPWVMETYFQRQLEESIHNFGTTKEHAERQYWQGYGAAMKASSNSSANEWIMTTLLIDADMLLFRTMAANEIEANLGDEVWVRWAELGTVREEFWKTIDEWLEVWHGADYRLCWTGPSAFRKRIALDYKANRSAVLKPIGYKVMKRELLDEPTSFQHDEIEADDWLGILAGALREAGEEPIIVSGDKDLDQVPGRHWWPAGVKREQAPGLSVLEWDDELLRTKAKGWHVDESYAERHFYSQVLIGDSTDNIPGCPGVGPVKAKQIIDKLDTSQPLECWQKIVERFEKARKKNDVWEPETFALQQARLVRILQHGEYDAKERSVTLWTPPTLKS